ncbi:antitoxin [Pseudomonas yamanorum]|uniref:type II toxin-antitoxin system RelB family antitoxin n=1 Tax=Pseudomonas yamanorum TaxID=515393 RepID=UPI0015A07899|nr:antitoxin [Pseudomonas yamanorum]NVZ84259.1 antitoxin [Pseudomonas yamanorum]
MSFHDVPELPESESSAVSYDCWFRANVQAALEDARPGIPHDQVMSQIKALIDAKRLAHKTY